MNFLQSRAQALSPVLKALKDDLHRHPERSFAELRTTALLREKLSALGLSIIDLGMDTGVVALLQGGRPGGTVALRADIDALAQQEPACPDCSEISGVMHACGHDFHTACLYGAAQLLVQQRDQLAGNVVFLFQPAEEIAQGAAAMIRHGLWTRLPEKPRWLFGLHNRPELPAGQVAVLEGPIMAGKCHFEIVLKGVVGHGGSPHKCTDVIVPGAALVGALQSVVSRNTDPLESLVCGVCSISAGTAENFIPDVLTMTGSMRAHSDRVMEQAKVRVEALARGTAQAYGCGVQVRFLPQVPPTWNGPELTQLARQAAAAVFSPEQVVCTPPDMGSEDFAVLGQDVPSFFYFLGSGTPNQACAPWHSEHFRTDDSALPLGAALLAQSALTALGQATPAASAAQISTDTV